MHTTRWLAAALVLAGATAFAGQDGESGRPTREEREAARAAAFAQADTDGNGALSAAEFATFKNILSQQRGQHWFSKMDANGDGQVTAEELQAARAHKRGCHRGERGA